MDTTKSIAWTVGVFLFFAVGAFGQRQISAPERSRDAASAVSTPVVSTPIEPDSPAADSGAAAGPQANSQAIVPRLIKFSGVLRDILGHPMTGPLDVTFALYDKEAGGDPLWYETQTVQADQLGRYTALLGAMHTDGLPIELFTSGEVRWLGIQVGHEQEQQPRVLLVSVPYALKAGDAETLGGKPASAYMLSASQSTGTSGSGAPSIVGTAQAGGTGKTKKGAGPLTITPSCTSMTGDGGAQAGQIALYTSACALGEDAGLVDVGGNVGIGTATPGYTLDVNGSLRIPNGTGVLYMNDATGAARRVSLWSALYHIYFGDIDNSTDSDLYFMAGGAGGQHFYTNGTEKVTILSGGNVGIGTSSPLYPLDVRQNINGLGRALFGNDNSGSNRRQDIGIGTHNFAEALYLGVDLGNAYGLGAGIKSYLDNRSGGSFSILNTGVNAVTIDTSGNVGIGTTTPAATLEVNGTAQFDGLATFGAGASITGTVSATSFSGSGSGLTNLTGANVTGSVASATSAGSATNALALGGVAAST